MLRAVARVLYGLLDIALAIPLLLVAAVSRGAHRTIDVGLGPLPLINNIHHKRALATRGYSAETFVHHTYHVTDDFDVKWVLPIPFGYLTRPALFVRALFRYRALYQYFDGGSLGDTALLWLLEPWLYRLAGIPVVVMAYGSDVQDMRRCPNLAFKAALAADYPNQHRKQRRIAAQVERWSRLATHTLAGCDWVDYLADWDTLMLGHFSIDTREFEVVAGDAERVAGPLRILHAPNHRHVKGTAALLEAVEMLRKEGLALELVLLEGVPNEQVREAIRACDVVADQFVIGWYAMFALEAMASGKPTLCYVRGDLEQLYLDAGLIEPGELPLVRASRVTLPDVLRRLEADRSSLPGIGAAGRRFVERHHSLEAVGAVFDRINRDIGLGPGAP